MIIDPSTPHKQARDSNVDPDNHQLRLNPGAPQRKPRSAGKFCLWLFAFIIVLFGGMGLYMFLSSFFYRMRHPHKDLYHDEAEAEIKDWSQVVRPMITEESKFDVIASVWIRDEDGKDAVISVDGEERPERLIFTDTVFRGMDVKSKAAFTNVTLRVPANYFKHVNLSNYDLRASFVLAQPSQNRPASWLDFAKGYTSWKPHGLKTPIVRKLDAEPSLEDQIYNSFGISIPLIEFHNITSKKSGTTHKSENFNPSPMQDNQSDSDSDDESDWDDEETTESETKTSTLLETTEGRDRNTFKLEFTGDKQPVTEYHPYIVTRTHLRIAKQNKLFKRLPYVKNQKELAIKTCVNSGGEPIKNPEWYQCHRSYWDTGVFETKVQLRIPSEDPEMKNDKKWRTEWLYAPFLSAMSRAAGPKELVPVPIDRENVTQLEDSQSLTPDEDYITVTWKLSFSSHTPEKLSWSDAAAIGMGNVYNMTEPDDRLEHMQHGHDLAVGLVGHRIDEDAHPRRMYLFGSISSVISIICWFLTIHYWYTRTSTTGISRLGTALLALWHFMGITEDILIFVLNPEMQRHWISMLGVTYVFHLITPLAMLITVLRLEFGWSTKNKRGGRDDEREKKGWIPRMSIAKATHLERASERIEARVSKKAKLLLFITLLAAAHLFANSESYIFSPRIPKLHESHPLESLSPHAQTILRCVGSFSVSSRITGVTLQFIMNFYSRTYAGNYKIATLLRLIAEVFSLLDVVPRVVGKTLRTHGVSVIEGISFVIAVVDLIQAVKYQNVKGEDAEDAE